MENNQKKKSALSIFKGSFNATISIKHMLYSGHMSQNSRQEYCKYSSH